MTLREYLYKHRLTEAHLARSAGVGQSTISRMAAGVSEPGLRIALAVNRATNGEVTLYDMLKIPHHSD